MPRKPTLPAQSTEVLFAPEPDNDDEQHEWLTTFADLSMLLLVFFVLLYSLSEIDPNKFENTFVSVTQALKHDKISTSRITAQEAAVLVDQVNIRRQIIEQQRKVFSDVKLLQTTKGVQGMVTASFEDGLITLRAPGDVFFESGQVEISPAGQRVLLAMKDFFLQHPRQTINIKGFTDNVPPRGGRFNDNWEISALRAVNVLRFLMDMGIEPKRLTATGLADLDPLVPNTTEENRAKNRRVEFVLERRM
jgi:chemotaxis protein MotB